MRIINKTRQRILADKVVMADSFVSRMVGLLNRTALLKDEALVITHCQSIHMFFMRFPIDVIFVDKNEKVVGLEKNIKPFRLSRLYFKADRALELPAGIIDESQTTLGDLVEVL